MKQKKMVLLPLLCLLLSMTACGGATEAGSTAESDAAQKSVTAASEMFTERELDPGYDEAGAAKILLEGSKATVEGKGVQSEEGLVTIAEEGVYLLSGKWKGQIVVDVADTAKVQLVLDGVDLENSASAALYIKQADKVFLTLAEGSENQVSTTGRYAADGDTKVDAAIFSKEDLCLQGGGSLEISGEEGNGITSKDDMKITGGEIRIDVPGHGLEGKDSVRIAEGEIAITCGEDGLHADNTEDEGKGFVYIAGGKLRIEAGDDGVHAANGLRILEGSLDIPVCYEGLEGHTIDIEGGEIRIVAADDGLNAAGGNDGSGAESAGGMGGEDPFATDEAAYLRIAGGSLQVDADGDGLDSNGSLYVEGGTVYVAGPENEGNGALDYNGEGKISGGTLVASGMSGMAMNFGESSTQGAILFTGLEGGGESFRLTKESGELLLEFSPEKNYDSVLVSSPELALGESYTAHAGSAGQTIEMTSLLMGAAGMGGGPGGAMPPGGEAQFPEGMPQEGMPQ